MCLFDITVINYSNIKCLTKFKIKNNLILVQYTMYLLILSAIKWISTCSFGIGICYKVDKPSSLLFCFNTKELDDNETEPILITESKLV